LLEAAAKSAYQQRREKKRRLRHFCRSAEPFNLASSPWRPARSNARDLILIKAGSFDSYANYSESATGDGDNLQITGTDDDLAYCDEAMERHDLKEAIESAFELVRSAPHFEAHEEQRSRAAHEQTGEVVCRRGPLLGPKGTASLKSGARSVAPIPGYSAKTRFSRSAAKSRKARTLIGRNRLAVYKRFTGIDGDWSSSSTVANAPSSGPASI
jgi:hypothetical protein